MKIAALITVFAIAAVSLTGCASSESQAQSTDTAPHVVNHDPRIGWVKVFKEPSIAYGVIYKRCDGTTMIYSTNVAQYSDGGDSSMSTVADSKDCQK